MKKCSPSHAFFFIKMYTHLFKSSFLKENAWHGGGRGGTAVQWELQAQGEGMKAQGALSPDLAPRHSRPPFSSKSILHFLLPSYKTVAIHPWYGSIVGKSALLNPLEADSSHTTDPLNCVFMKTPCECAHCASHSVRGAGPPMRPHVPTLVTFFCSR